MIKNLANCIEMHLNLIEVLSKYLIEIMREIDQIEGREPETFMFKDQVFTRPEDLSGLDYEAGLQLKSYLESISFQLSKDISIQKEHLQKIKHKPVFKVVKSYR